MAGSQSVHKTIALLGGVGLFLGGAAMAQQAETQQPAVTQLPEINVIGVTPVHGVGIAKDKFPANVQEASGEEIRDSQAVGLGEFMSENMASVWVNEGQNNPLQPNVSYRGYTVSPLLGLPQGLAIYQDGVRINEPFGDTVNFSLIPQSAISSMELVPGSNPAFGLNAMGGAISIQTKSGLSDPGTAGEAYYGSFGRHFLQLQHGGSQGAFNYFITGEYFSEDGWRDLSPSLAKRLFANLGWTGEESRLNLKITTAKTDLVGNGTAPVQLLEQDREAIFTAPDKTMSKMLMFDLEGDTNLSDNVVLSGNVYFRRNNIDTQNGDDADYDDCPNGTDLCYEDTNDQVMDSVTGNPVPYAPGGQEIDGTNNMTRTEQDGYGGNMQLTFMNDLFVGENQLTVGAGWDNADVNYNAKTYLAYLDRYRRAISTDYIDADSFVRIDAYTRNYGLYFTDTWSVTPALDLTLSGRYNHSRITLKDRIDGAASGRHSYSHFNPAVGAVYEFVPAFATYARYSISNRAPTPMELTCSNPAAPCRLPNDFIDDPHLDQVVSKTVEFGGRGHLGSGIWGTDWNLGFFQTMNHDDIQFISTAAVTSNQGFFKNMGKTRHRGIEFTLRGYFKDLNWFLGYTYLDAEYRESFQVQSPEHPDADSNGLIDVKAGNRIPLTPHNLFKLGADYAITPKFKLGATLLYTSDQVMRMDESNQLKPISGYTVVNMRGQYQLNDNWTLFARVNNLFDKEYATFGGLGEGDEVLGPQYDNPRFLGPAAPRAVWVGVRASF